MLRRNVLIFHSAALGDFLMTWPLAMALGRVLAQSRIIYVTSAQKGRLAERALGVEFNDIEHGWHALYGQGASLPETPVRLLKSMQLGVLFSQEKEEQALASIAAHSADAPVLHISPNPPRGMHVWQHQLDQLKAFPVIFQGVEQVQKLIRAQGLVRKPAGPADPIVIHPGSGAARKNWPIERFIDLASSLRNRGKAVIIALGEVEREQLSTADVGRLGKVAELRKCETTLDLYDLLNSAGAYVGNDSGPTHLAAMLGLRVVALFGPTSDAVAWAPVGPRVTILPFEAAPSAVESELLQG
ncbi:MAG: glycosyltransferase family 9 protein [Burkholderiales bacterium]|nr:glycosyltransferase family 9 protein [Phycisphaerae bacterium]